MIAAVAAAGKLETEMKFGAWPGFTLPDLHDVVPGVTVGEPTTFDLDAIYVDTEDLRLVRNGVSLRRRTGEGATRWTLKLPSTGGDGDALRRREFDVETDVGSVPPELADLVVGWVRGAALAPVATIRTTRHRVDLLRDGRRLAEVDDDVVTVVEGDEVAARFREIEVELADGASSDLLALVAGALERAGAGAPDRTTKVVRALGPRALAPPDLTVAEVGPRATTAEVVRAALAEAARRLVERDHVVRLDDDVEGVHQARVATRRLRTVLATFGPVLDGDVVEGLRAELGWLAGLLGVVRDTDVLLERLRDAASTLDAVDRGAVAAVLARLERERAERFASLLGEMRTARYVELLDRVVATALEPPLTRAARGPAAEAVAALVRPRWIGLRRAVAGLGPQPAEDDLHEVRILVKKARDAVEVVVPVVGQPARRLADALDVLQRELGELSDAAVAQEWLRALTPSVPPAQAMVVGQLVGDQRRRSRAAGELWPQAWAACERKANVRWLG
ncbi:MAG: CYTH and CHAD domain-containing protein [Acidimicrobiales bacterium]|nr:CYTH and CHAD domain-containing protein [Acidimicrobiales bacterium]